MNRVLVYLAGPELIWVVAYALTALLISRNNPPTLEGNQRLELIGWFLPTLSTLLSFAPFWWLPDQRWLLLARVVLAGLVGAVLVTSHLCGGIDYQDSRNSGVGTAFVLFVGLSYMLLLALAIVTALLFLFRKSQG